MFERHTPLEKEWAKLEKKEAALLAKKMEKTDSKLNQLLEKKIPPNLQNTLNVAFAKAFYLVFEKGTGVIEKTYKRDELEKTYQINEFATNVRGNRKSLKAFSQKAAGAGRTNIILSGVSGMGLGVLGIGIPDIVLLTGLMLKSVYEIALNYGFDYRGEEEKHFILLLIQGAFAHGKELICIDKEVNYYIETGKYLQDKSIAVSVDETAGSLSKEMLYMKFLQGIPIVGVAGGVYDSVYMGKVVKYAELKYRRRFFESRKKQFFQ